MALIEADLAPFLPAQAGDCVLGAVEPIEIRVASADVALPGLALHVVPYSVPVEIAVVREAAVPRVGADPLGERAEIPPEGLQQGDEAVDVRPVLGDVIGEHEAPDDQRPHVVGGMHVGPEPGIVVRLQAHGGGVAVRLVIGSPARPADPLLVLVFHGLQQHGAQGLARIGIFLLRHRGPQLAEGGNRVRHGLGRDHLFGPVAPQDPQLSDQGEERGAQPPVEDHRLPDELVFVRVDLDLRPVDEGVLEGRPRLLGDLAAEEGEDLPLVGDDHLVDELCDRRIVDEGLLHQGDVAEVVHAGVREIPDGVPVEGEAVQDGREQPVVVAVGAAAGGGVH